MRKLVTMGNRSLVAPITTIREKIQSLVLRPCLSTWAALASSIKLETSTALGHSVRHS